MLRRLLALAALAFGSATAAGATEWPHHARGVVVLTYDDALTSQLDHAVPLLDRARLKATFFLSNIKRAEVPRWRAVARKGHELANHSLFHPCAAARYPADPRYTLERYTPASALKEIEEQNAFLVAIDDRREHGFGTPCGDTLAGGADYLEPLRAAGIVSYARSRTATPADFAADASTMDPFRVPALDFPDKVTARELIAVAERARDGGGMAVFVFHGVAGDYLQVSNAAHRGLIAWLAAHRRDVWVTTLGKALAWARAHPGRPR